MIVSPVLIWFLVGIGFFLMELAIPGFIIFFLGAGAWCVALVLAVADISLTTQLIIFIACSLITLVVLRTRLRSVFSGVTLEQDDSVNMEDHSGSGVVIDAIEPPALGRIQYGGSYWKARANEPIVKDTVVTIVEKKNLIVTVRIAAKERENE